VVGLLLERGCDVGIPNLVGRTALHHAVIRLGGVGSKFIVKELLRAGALVNCADLVGWSPLHSAVTFCSDAISGPLALRSDVVGMLVKAKADVNSVTSIDSVSPLHVAAFYDSEWDVLLMAGADTQLKEAGGRRVIDIAHTMAPRMGYLEDQSAAPEWLSPHTDHRKLLMLLEKMEAGFEIDAQATMAARNKSRPLKEDLLASANAHTDRPFTPSKEIPGRLTPLRGLNEKEKAVNFDIPTRNLYWAACHRSYPKMIDAIESGAEVNSTAIDNRQRTALHWAASNDHVAGVQLLLEHEADPNLSSTWLRTPLMHAAGQNSKQVCQLLIKHGAEVNAVTQAGHTAADQARLSGHIELSEWLKEQ